MYKLPRCYQKIPSSHISLNSLSANSNQQCKSPSGQVSQGPPELPGHDRGSPCSSEVILGVYEARNRSAYLHVLGMEQKETSEEDFR